MSAMEKNLFGKVALVTGAARGLGAEVARALSERGARVVLSDILIEEGRATAAALESAIFIEHDVTDETQWEDVVQRTVGRFGALDVLVNNAGIETMALFANCTLKDFRRVQQVNVEGTFLGIKFAIQAMRPGGIAGRGGSIINMSSVAGLVGVPGMAAYCTAKGAVRLMTKAAAIECARLAYGIRVNSIHPAIIKTRMGINAVHGLVDIGLATDDEAAEMIMGNLHPMGYGEPKDVSDAVCYLASSATKWMNGAELVLDGGLTAS